MRTPAATLALLCALLAGCGRNDEAATAPTAASRVDPLQAFLTATGEWPETIGQFDYTSKVCFDRTVDAVDGPQRWVAVCSTNRDDAHGAAGSNALYVLDARGEPLRAIATAHGLEFGSNGNPGEVELLPLGAGRYAFSVGSGWTGQGYAIGSRTLLAPHGDQVVEVATWYDDFGFGGNCAEADRCADALEYATTLEVAPGAGAGLPPLRLHERGDDCGTPVDRVHDVTFDAATWRYRVPAILVRQECTTPPVAPE